MKTILNLLLMSVIFTSCGKYVSLTRESYEMLNNNGNVLKAKAKFEKPIELEYLMQDTIIATVNTKGVCNFNTVKRSIESIPAGAKVKIKEAEENIFKVEFVDYKLTLSMIRTTNDNYIILTSKENIVAHTRYVVKDNDPNIMIKVKRSKSKQNVSLKK